MSQRIVAAIVTRNRHEELRHLVVALERSTIRLDGIVIVDNGSGEAPLAKSLPWQTTYVRCSDNIGGAAGFALAVLHALAVGADWVWLMDDDACPLESDCLERLLDGAEHFNLAVASPLIVASLDHDRTAFPFRLSGRLSYDRSRISKQELIPNVAHFFNGALVRRQVFLQVGIPESRLFVRGDEVDFLLRLRRSKIRFGTLTSCAVQHPPGWDEVVPIVTERIHVLIPAGRDKRYYFFRNRGYLARKHRRLSNLVSDIVLYPYAFLVIQRGNTEGLREWARAFWHGLTYDFGRSVD
jgi:rhamnopyranosyl-N-acetylglucosaminyl-diphospho-decaprenol beta-1,3/1,4-galactofuranosyltransferase